ncbi:MAG: hypothetical protein H8E18_09615 [FCB group bacterium]|nr:hypothetical protein [FCB group bacterium]
MKYFKNKNRWTAAELNDNPGPIVNAEDRIDRKLEASKLMSRHRTSTVFAPFTEKETRASSALLKTKEH